MNIVKENKDKFFLRKMHAKLNSDILKILDVKFCETKDLSVKIE